MRAITIGLILATSLLGASSLALAQGTSGTGASGDAGTGMSGANTQISRDPGTANSAGVGTTRGPSDSAPTVGSGNSRSGSANNARGTADSVNGSRGSDPGTTK